MRCSWPNFNNFIRNNNIMRNFNVEDNDPDPQTGLVAMPFLVPGWPKERLRMRLELLAKLPRGARLFLEAPLAFLERAQALTPDAEIDQETGMARIPVKAAGRHTFADMVFPASARFRMRLLADVPEKARGHAYRIVARQMHGDDELGRVTWMLAPRG